MWNACTEIRKLEGTHVNVKIEVKRACETQKDIGELKFYESEHIILRRKFYTPLENLYFVK